MLSIFQCIYWPFIYLLLESVQIFCPFLIKLFDFVLVSCRSSLCPVFCQIYADICFPNIFCQSSVCLLSFLEGCEGEDRAGREVWLFWSLEGDGQLALLIGHSGWHSSQELKEVMEEPLDIGRMLPVEQILVGKTFFDVTAFMVRYELMRKRKISRHSGPQIEILENSGWNCMLITNLWNQTLNYFGRSAWEFWRSPSLLRLMT